MTEFIELLNQTPAPRLVGYSVVGIACLLIVCITISEVSHNIFNRKK